MKSQPFLQLWYFFTCRPYIREFWIRASWEVPLLPLNRTERRGKQFSFFITGYIRVLLGCSWSALFCVTMSVRADFSISCSKPHQKSTGQMGEKGCSASLLLPLCPTVLPQVCWSMEGSQPKLAPWAGNSKVGESQQEISCQNLKQNILPELLAAATEIRPQLSAALCEHGYCVCVCI